MGRVAKVTDGGLLTASSAFCLHSLLLAAWDISKTRNSGGCLDNTSSNALCIWYIYYNNIQVPQNSYFDSTGTIVHSLGIEKGQAVRCLYL